jgi:hypothetical protein
LHLYEFCENKGCAIVTPSAGGGRRGLGGEIKGKKGKPTACNKEVSGQSSGLPVGLMCVPLLDEKDDYTSITSINEACEAGFL